MLPDAANNSQSGPFATAVQRVLAVPLFLGLLPLGVAYNLMNWALATFFRGGVPAMAGMATLPRNNGYRLLSSRVRVLNATELSERAMDLDRAQVVFGQYIEANGFSPDEVGIEVASISPDTTKQEVYRELYTREATHLVTLFVRSSGSHTIVCGLFDFGFFDGTSCFNFIKGFLSACFDDEIPVNRPNHGPLRLRLSDQLRPRLKPGYTLRVALAEGVQFALGWSRWGLAREGYDILVPPETSSAMATLGPEDNAAMLAALKTQGIKPFEHLLRCSAQAFAEHGDVTQVKLLTQISCQSRYYEPPLPRDQVGYWLIGRSSEHGIADMTTVDFCRSYYQSLKSELDDFSGLVRHAFVRQVMLGFGGSGGLANLRSVFWFNNYGKREMTPKAGPVTYHWGPNHRLGCYALINIISVNDVTCLTISSTTLSQATIEKVVERMGALLKQPEAGVAAA